MRHGKGPSYVPSGIVDETCLAGIAVTVGGRRGINVEQRGVDRPE